MKPKYLEFCGINSFSEPAKIDFEKLLQSGIFGIFGDTGSGKTTILDAIVFALYGKVERSRGGVGSDVINYGCDKAYVIFEFESVEENQRSIYRIEREIRRKNSLQKAELLKINKGVITPLADGKVSSVNALVQEIIGLNFEDFKKCIALPQGEFSKFVKEEKSERLKLVSRLFGLEEYGEKLNNKLRERINFCSGKISYYEGILAAFSDVSEQKIIELNDLICKTKVDIENCEQKREEAEKQFNILKSAYEKGVELSKIEIKLAILEEKSNEMSEKRNALKKYAGAQNALEKNREIVAIEKNVLELQNNISKLKIIKETALKNLENLNESTLQKLDDEILDYNKKLVHAQYLQKDGENLSSKNKELQSVNFEIEKFNSEISKYNVQLREIAEKERILLEKEDLLYDPELILKKKYGSSILKEEYEKALSYFNEKKDVLINNYSNESQLYRNVESSICERIAHYDKLLGEIEISCSPEQAFKEYQSLSEVKEKTTKALHKLEIDKKTATLSLETAKEKVLGFQKKQEELTNEISEISKKINEVMGETDYFSFVKSLQDKIKQLEENRKKLSKDIEENKKLSSEAESEIKSLSQASNLHSQSLEKNKKHLAQILSVDGFTSLEQAKELIERYPNFQTLTEEVESYDNEKISLLAQRDAFSTGKISVSEQEVNDSEEKLKSLTKEKQTLVSNLTVNSEKLKECQEKIAKKIENEKHKNYFQEKHNLLEKLRSIIKGNQFMEFIASEYLSDISAAASETLLKLTSGRYFIRYNQGFFVGDNYNGGELRAVATLSGGETFLVSLSLALSLSSAIYAKSLKPIEFFFLDEGFGTLDEKLVDTVMDSLEKLKNTHFSIGLISHVEELKHRIDNKIIVIGATEGGSSKIQINY